ncbi:alpha-1,2-fucosyltransferase [Salmonella enterica subsp. houtenae serovar 43:z4]|nr:alpha-1,2-fucosyltransferase [Salmonella enterica]QQI32560.1 alpha-1,2-fucosyltransferase [Salmonella enterica subsp. houtenae serovar 43:z4]
MFSCLSGGLGNQMFQYSAAYILKKNICDAQLIIDDSYFYCQPQKDTPRNFEINQFNIVFDRVTTDEEKRAISKLRKFKKIPLPLFKSNVITEFLFDKTLLTDEDFYNVLNKNKFKVKMNACLFSFYQDSSLINKYRNLILPLFTINDELLQICQQLDSYGFICEHTNTTSLHIRRGDYVTNPHAAKFHGTLSMDYYSQAMSYIEHKLGKQLFVIFSDDVQWATEKFGGRSDCYIVNNVNCQFSAVDMYLMSLCKNNIIANSTYSWWGGWLNKSEEKLVIAPQKWFAEDKESLLAVNDWISI